ncbi:hypothetical protein [Agitococcus lubricus]|nr:hypothetical protein [Agitococcus lubricus]
MKLQKLYALAATISAEEYIFSWIIFSDIAVCACHDMDIFTSN